MCICDICTCVHRCLCYLHVCMCVCGNAQICGLYGFVVYEHVSICMCGVCAPLCVVYVWYAHVCVVYVCVCISIQ